MGSTILVVLLVVGGLVVVLVLFLVMMYNALVILRNRYKNAFAQIDVQLKRRYDLIPNLVETVKGYMSHERETLEAVIKARNSAVNAGPEGRRRARRPAAMQELDQAEAQLTGSLGRLMAFAEAYPDLKANQNMLALQEELTAHREQDRLLPPGLQRRGHDLQHRARDVSRRRRGRHVRLHRGEAVRSDRVAAEREAPKVSF